MQGKVSKNKREIKRFESGPRIGFLIILITDSEREGD